ncbi:MAG: O-antigen ligase family protein [Oceanospirillaceae bacterium]|nr:O-antigen ligase family protein [Oceanospirillaceae bacterium]
MPTSTSTDKLFYAFLLLLIWIPLPLGSNLPWASMLLGIFSLTLCVIWIGLYLLKRVKLSRSFKKARYALVLLGLAQGFVAYQYFFAQSIDTNASLQQLILGISFSGLFALSLLLINSTQRIKLTIYAIVASGLFQAVYGSLMTLTGIEYLLFVEKDHYLGVATGTFVNRNHLAGYLVICLSVGLGLMIGTLKPGTTNIKENLRRILQAILSQKIILRLSLVIMVAGLVMTHSRMGNSAFFIAMGIVGTLAIMLKGKSMGSTIVLLLSLLIIDVAVVGTFFGIEKVIDRIEGTSEKHETRDEVNGYSLELFNENQLTGTGAGTYFTAFPEVRERDVGFIFYNHAHNDYLQFLTERGIIGITPLILFVLMTFLVAFRGLYQRKNALLRGCAFGSLMSMIAMAMHATVDFNLQIPANAATFMVVLALGWIGMFYKERKG